MFDSFTDPAPVREPQGLQHGECCDCGGVALVDAQYEGRIRCSACWSKFHKVADLPVPRRGASAHHVVVPRIVRGELDAPRRTSIDRLDTNDTVDQGADTPGRYRVITPARDCRDYADAVAPAALQLWEQLTALGEKPVVTYALAEDLKLARLVESAAVRVPHVGYAIWQRTGDGSWSTLGAQIADPLLRSCSVTEFVALALGKVWTPPKPPAPPIKGPCPRCSTPGHPNVVRWKKDPFEPYAHNRPARAKETKIKCLPSD
jgi:hypothetical protein